MLIARTPPRPLDLSRTEILPSGGREAGIARSTPLMKGSEKNGGNGAPTLLCPSEP